MAQVGAENPFGRVSDPRKRLTRVPLGENSVRDVTQDVEGEIMAQEQAWIVDSQDTELLLDNYRLSSREKPDRLSGSLDGVRVPMVNWLTRGGAIQLSYDNQWYSLNLEEW